MKNTPKFKAGDRVINKNSYGQPAGVLIKVNRVTAVVKYDRDTEPKTLHLDGFRHETAEDTAKRTYQVAYAAWRDAMPKTTVAQVGYTALYTSMRETHVVVSATTSSLMRDAAHELMLLADWWDTRPKEPTR